MINQCARWLFLVLISTCLASACVPRPAWQQAHVLEIEKRDLPARPVAPNRPIRTMSADAQALFNLGLSEYLILDFKKAEYYFREAVGSDNRCTLCYWGLALVLNSKSDVIMNGTEYHEGEQALYTAEKLIVPEMSSPLEIALLQALHLRYQKQVLPHFRTTIDNGYFNYEQSDKILQNYADAMGRIIEDKPKDWGVDLNLLYVMAQFEANGWQAWTADHQPLPETHDLIEITENAIAVEPNNAAAHLLRVKLLQNSRNPEKALQSAHFLMRAMPNEGTLPLAASLLFNRLHDYYNAGVAAEIAVQSYERQYAENSDQKIIPDYLYIYSFYALSRAATQQGQLETAMGAARAARARIYPNDIPYAAELPILVSEPYFVLVRFGKWERALQEPQPTIDHPFVQSSWHFMRGMALASLYRLDLAQEELSAIQRYNNRLPTPNMMGHEQMELEALMLQARMEQKDNHEKWAIETLKQGLALEERANKSPLPWFMPVRQALGEVYLQAGDTTAARTAFMDDLRNEPNNARGLYGLSQAYYRAGIMPAASRAHEDFARAWKYSDQKIDKSWM
jgi:tetratricopeptide (TPR) repeat protein